LEGQNVGLDIGPATLNSDCIFCDAWLGLGWSFTWLLPLP